ncbi:MAG: C25 family cysteine peptidase, partial [Bacteroidota bacterium]
GGTSSSDHLTFAGKRNTGEDEIWAYNYEPTAQSSPDRSLYTDTTTYWLTWAGAPGLRYSTDSATGGTSAATLPLTSWLEEDRFYFSGSTAASTSPLYTAGEGWYFQALNHNSATAERRVGLDIPIAGATRNAGDQMTVRVKMNGTTASQHLVRLFARIDTNGDNATELVQLDSVQWIGYEFAILEAQIPQNQLRAGDAALRIEVASDNSFGGNPNNLAVDYVEGVFEGTPTASAGFVRFDAPGAGTYAFQVAGMAGNVIALNPDGAKRYTAATFSAATQAGEDLWVAQESALKSAVVGNLEKAVNLDDSSLQANYLIIAAPGLLASAQTQANYRASASGGNHQVIVANVQDVYDQFDYGRPTSIAIRRLVARSQLWQTPPEYVLLWGDALLADPKIPSQSWETISFGRPSSDGWFGMQTASLDDYTEQVSIGRISLRSNGDGDLYVEKLSTYEAAPLEEWQKKFIMMAGGKDAIEQSSLHGFTRQWGTQVADAPFGADVTYFLKSDDTVLDPTFLDTVDARIQNGSGWLSFFGHSAATTWEIVTKPPHEFDNAGRLPIVFSLGCYTGAFGAGDGSPDDQVSFGEELVAGSLNGAIAHWGGSASSYIGPAATIATPAYDQIVGEGERTLGLILTEAKRRYVTLVTPPSPRTVETTLHYNLIGDPATRVAFPGTPDYHIEARSIRLDPLAPTPTSDDSVSVIVEIENYGVFASQSAELELTHWLPSGESVVYSKTIAPFALADTVTFRIPVEETTVGENRYMVRIDPDGSLTEANEANNTADRTQTVFSTGVSLVYPPTSGISPDLNPTLRISVASQDAAETPVLFELDTVPTFDGSGFQSFETSATLTAEWQPTGLQDGQTYYWRARVIDPSQPPTWKQGSFTVAAEFTQQGFIQQGDLLAENEISPLLSYDGDDWAYKAYNLDINIKSKQLGGSQTPEFVVDGIIYHRNKVGLALVVLDKTGQFLYRR